MRVIGFPLSGPPASTTAWVSFMLTNFSLGCDIFCGTAFFAFFGAPFVAAAFALPADAASVCSSSTPATAATLTDRASACERGRGIVVVAG